MSIYWDEKLKNTCLNFNTDKDISLYLDRYLDNLDSNEMFWRKGLILRNTKKSWLS